MAYAADLNPEGLGTTTAVVISSGTRAIYSGTLTRCLHVCYIMWSWIYLAPYKNLIKALTNLCTDSVL